MSATLNALRLNGSEAALDSVEQLWRSGYDSGTQNRREVTKALKRWVKK